MKLVVLGTPSHEGKFLSSVFDRLGAAPAYLLDELPLVEEAIDADAIVVSREWSKTIRLTVARARRRGIPVVYVMDGVIEWSYLWNNLSFVRPEGTVLQPLLASHLCVIGQHPARILSGLGLGPAIRVVGLPRLDAVSRERTIDLQRAPTIVVATPRTAGHDTEQRVMIRRALRDLRDWFGQQTSVTPQWRISPELALELGVSSELDDDPLPMLRRANGLIAFTSTVLLEAQLLGLPTAQIDYRAVPQYVQTAWSIRSREHIPGIVQELLFPPPQTLAYQAACLRDELEPGVAADRLAAVIRDAASSTRRRTRTRRASGVGTLDFRQVHSDLSAFAIADPTVLQYELDAASKLLDLLRPEVLRLQAALAESEQTRIEATQAAESAGREVEHLRKERAALAALVARQAPARETARLTGYRPQMSRLATRLERQGVRKTFIFGAGEAGEALLLACRAHGIDVPLIADRDPRLWGLALHGVPIVPLDACLEARSAVFAIGSIAHAREIRATILAAFHHRPRPRIYSTGAAARR